MSTKTDFVLYMHTRNIYIWFIQDFFLLHFIQNPEFDPILNLRAKIDSLHTY